MRKVGGSPKQKRSLGQVFLRQSWPIDRMVERLTELKVENILEIGPGAGVLTKALLKSGFQVTSVERDDRFVEVLKDLESEFFGAFNVVPENILKFDLANWLSEQTGVCAVVGNIPYNISSPILMWGMPHLDKLAVMMVMTQLEFAQRVVASNGNKNYGSLSVYIQLRAHASMLFKVGRSCFKPIPKVDSAVIELRQTSSTLSPELLEMTEKVTRRAFMQRRKVLRNSVLQWLGEKDIAACPIDLSRRPETLTPQEFISLGQFLFK